MGDTQNDPVGRSPLLPVRHAQADFFVCDVLDAVAKADIASMEHPIFSLSTRPDLRVRRYEQGEIFVEVIPSVVGLATVHDRDILIYCISQVVAALNEGRAVRKTVRLKAYDLLVVTNRMVNGQAYDALKLSLQRLAGTQVSTNVKTGGVEEFDTFALISRGRVVRQTRDGRMQDIEVELSDWVFNAIEAREVLTLHRDYFRLRKPLERRLYELARKHCGRQPSWSIGLERLRGKCGSISSPREFRRMLRNICQQDLDHAHMPDYAVSMEPAADGSDKIVFRRRRDRGGGYADTTPTLSVAAIEAGRAAAPGWDVYAIARDWRDWCVDNDIVPGAPDRHFAAFARSWAERRGT